MGRAEEAVDGNEKRFGVSLFTTSSDKREKCLFQFVCDGFELIIERSYSYQVYVFVYDRYLA